MLQYTSHCVYRVSFHTLQVTFPNKNHWRVSFSLLGYHASSLVYLVISNLYPLTYSLHSMNIIMYPETCQTLSQTVAFILISSFLGPLFNHIHPQALGATLSNSCCLSYLRPLPHSTVEGQLSLDEAAGFSTHNTSNFEGIIS